MLKKITALLTALILIMSCAVLTAYAGVTDNPRVVDKADILTDSEEAALTAKLTDYSKKLDCDLVFLTEPDFEHEDYYYDGTIKGFADAFYENNGYDIDNGVIVMITLDNGRGSRDIHFSHFGKTMKTFTDEEREQIIDDVYSDLKNGDYYTALDKIADELLEKVPVNLKWYMLPLAIIIGLLIAILIMLMLKKKLKTVEMQRGAASYVRPGSMHVTASRDTYLYSTVSKTPRQTSSSSGGGSRSGGSSHSSGGGRSF